VQRVMTDNGSCYRSFAFARTCKRLDQRALIATRCLGLGGFPNG